MKHILAILIFFCTTSILFAQRNCPSIIDLVQMQTQDPARYQRFMDLETFTANYITNQGGPIQRLINQNGVITIPVVVHVLHRGEAIGSGRNISLAQIQSQITALNEDFRRLNSDKTNTPSAFTGVASDFGFEFRLACQDPNGNPTDGVVRRQTNKNSFTYISLGDKPNENAMGIKMSSISGSDPWPTNTYLNIWVVDFSDATLGYATFPGDFANNPNVDGIVIETTSMGRTGNVSAPFEKGRTATHEIGHWLNLRHIWGDAICGTDFVDDTPQQRVPNTGCPSFPHQSNCPNNGINGDMFMNYMDYTDDGCMNIYTNGQRLRGRAIFASGGPRASFLENYFRIIPPSSTINCFSTIRLFNPTCLPVTWSITSGPAIIAGGQTTNNVQVQATGTGMIHLVATAGNYKSEIDFSMTGNAPSSIIGLNLQYLSTDCYNPIDRYTVIGADGATNYKWYYRKLPNYPFTLKKNGPENFYDVTGGTPGECIDIEVKVEATNPCSTSIISYTLISDQCRCTKEEAVSGLRIVNISPNPSQSVVEVELLGTYNNSKELKEIKTIIIFDKTGNIKKNLSGNRLKKMSVDVSTLIPDIYTLSVFDGEQWGSIKFIKR